MLSNDTTSLSIRQIICRDIVHNVAKAETQQKVVGAKPESAAAKKFNIHYAWYKGWLKKNADQQAKFI